MFHNGHTKEANVVSMGYTFLINSNSYINEFSLNSTNRNLKNPKDNDKLNGSL